MSGNVSNTRLASVVGLVTLFAVVTAAAAAISISGATASTGAGFGDAAGSERPSVPPAPPATGFGSVETDERGDITRIPLRGVPADGYATVTLGSQDAGYVSNVTVHDANGDGYVVLRWNSYLADRRQGDNSPWSAAGGDAVVNQNVQTSIGDGPSHIISAGTYTLEVRDGRIRNGAASDPAEELATVTLTRRETNDVTTWTAPAHLAGELTTVSDIYSRAGDEITRDDDIAKGDILITTIDATGLEGALKAQDRGDPTANFYGAVAEGVVTMNYSQLTAGANRQLDVISVSEFDTGTSVTVIPDYERDTYFVVFDTGTDDRLGAGEPFRTYFTVESLHESQANFGLVAPDAGKFRDEVVTSEFEMVRRQTRIATTPDGVVEVRAKSGQTISGTSTHAPSTQLRLRIQSKSGSETPFIMTPTTTVAKDGTWSVTRDFSKYAVGTEFTVRVSKDGETVARADGKIRGKPTVKSLTFEDQESRGTVVYVARAEFNTGGFVVLREGSATGPVVGVSGYIERNTLTTNIAIPLREALSSSTTLVAVPYVDENHNQEFDPGTDGPFTSGGSPVTDPARITVVGVQADFQVSELKPTEVSVVQDETYDVAATVTNGGSVAGTQTVEYRIDGNTVETRRVTLDPGETTSVTFSRVSTEGVSAGTHSHGIYTNGGSRTGTLEVVSVRPTNYVIEDLEPGDVTVDAGEGVAVEATITNTGSTGSEQVVELQVDGRRVGSISVDLSSGETGNVGFTGKIDTGDMAVGDHTYSVVTPSDSERATLTIESGPSGTVETLSLSDEGASSDGVTVAEVELSAGGFVAIHEGNASGPVVGVSDYLDAGERHEDVSISFDESVDDGTDVVAVAHYDTNDNREFDYAESGGSVDEPYATDGSAVASQEVEGSESSDGGDASGGIPFVSTVLDRFGPLPLVGAGILAVAVVGLVLYRLRDTSDEPPEGFPGDETTPSPAQAEPSPDRTDETGAIDAPEPSEPVSGDAVGSTPAPGPTEPTPDEATGPAPAPDAAESAPDEMADHEPTGEERSDEGTVAGSADQPAGASTADETVDGEPATDAAAEGSGDTEETADRTAEEGAGAEAPADTTVEEEPGTEAPADAAEQTEAESGGGRPETGAEAGEPAPETDDTPAPAAGEESDAAAQADTAAEPDEAPASESVDDSDAPAATGGAGEPDATAGGTATGGSPPDSPAGADSAPSGGPGDLATTLAHAVPSLGSVQLQAEDGGFATFRATMATPSGDFPVDVLTVAGDGSVTPAVRERFEALASQWYDASTHENVRTAHEWGTDPRPYVVVDGLPNATTFADARTSMTLDQTVEVVNDIAAALGVVEQKGGHHHNLSLDCIGLFTGQNRYSAVVGDWGLERIVREGGGDRHVTAYTAPEQLDGEGDERTDVYGLGAVTYHAMTGRPPVQPDPDAIQRGDVAHANEFVQIPPQADVAIMTALSTDPADRHESPRAFGQALADAFW